MFFETIYMPWELNTGTCLWQGDLFYSAGLHRNHVLATTNTGKTPLKHIRKIKKTFQAKAIQGHVPWLNLKEKFQISFSQYANKVGTPLFRFMRQAQTKDTHALNQLGVSQNSSLL